MQGNKAVLVQLNHILRHQLTTINQFFLHARMLKNQGFEEVGDVMYKQSIHEMKNADAVIARILLLEGLPNLQDLGKLFIGESLPEMLSCDLKAEALKHDDLLAAVAVCENEQDYVSRKLLVTLKDDNEEYIDWLENQQELIESMSLANYLQSSAE